jgi:hypothetical protein
MLKGLWESSNEPLWLYQLCEPLYSEVIENMHSMRLVTPVCLSRHFTYCLIYLDTFLQSFLELNPLLSSS